MSIDITEFYQTFFDEADELLDEMEQLLIQLDIDSPDNEQLHAIFRTAHSIKGGAGTFGFTYLQETTHLLENLLDRARHRELVLDRAMVDVFLETRDMLKDQLEAYRSQSEPDPEACDRICQTLKQMAEENGAASVAKPQAAVSVPAAQNDSTDSLLDITIRDVDDKEREVLVEELALFGEIVARDHADGVLTVRLAATATDSDIESVLCFIIDAGQLTIVAAAAGDTAEPAPAATPAPARSQAESGAAVPQEKPAQGNAKPAKRAASPSSESSSLRVSTEKVDQIINLVGELVITQSMLEQTTANLDAEVFGALAEGINQLQRNARDLQEAVMSVRMMPMDYAFNRFPRLVRDLSKKLGKEVNLVTVGESTELDKGLIERIMDPMTHLVRNSLDHGIETPEKRLAAGKPAAGTLTLAAQHQGGNILIEIKDDGGGLNRDRILAKAGENGLPVSEGMADDEVWQLIFAPGFSTAEAVTDVSGRGVGMDVVKRNIQQLGGHVDIRSTPGQGTTICIVLPLTLAIMDGMSVKVGDEVFIMPLGAIVESMQVRQEQINVVTGSERVLSVRGEYLALVEMHRVFDVPGAQTDVTQGIVMVVESEGRRFALLVDELLGQHQVVVKNLETNYRKVTGVSAATILGDGSVALILDVPALSRSACERRNQPDRTAVRTVQQLQQEVVA